jgi:hypothetical protein
MKELDEWVNLNTGESIQMGQRDDGSIDVGDSDKELRRRDKQLYVKWYDRHFFSILELSAMSQKCWLLIAYYLPKGIEFFYMTKSAMLKLMESHFGKAPHEKNIDVAFKDLVKKGYMVYVDDGLWIVNQAICFRGERLDAIKRNYEFDLFGTRDPMARTYRTNADIDFKTDVWEYLESSKVNFTIMRNRCLGELRKKSKMPKLK